MFLWGILMPLIGIGIGVILQWTKLPLAPVDWMTLSLLAAIDLLINANYHYQALGWLIVVIASVGILTALGLAWHQGEILYRRFFKLWWRLLFFPSLIVYVVLISVHFI